MRARQRMERHGRRQVVQQVVTVVMRMKHFAEHAAERMVAAESDQASGSEPHVVRDLAKRRDRMKHGGLRRHPEREEQQSLLHARDERDQAASTVAHQQATPSQRCRIHAADRAENRPREHRRRADLHPPDVQPSARQVALVVNVVGVARAVSEKPVVPFVLVAIDRHRHAEWPAEENVREQFRVPAASRRDSSATRRAGGCRARAAGFRRPEARTAAPPSRTSRSRQPQPRSASNRPPRREATTRDGDGAALSIAGRYRPLPRSATSRRRRRAPASAACGGNRLRVASCRTASCVC